MSDAAPHDPEDDMNPTDEMTDLSDAAPDAIAVDEAVAPEAAVTESAVEAVEDEVAVVEDEVVVVEDEVAVVEDEVAVVETAQAEVAETDEAEGDDVAEAAVDGDDDEVDEAEADAEPSPWLRPGQWFVVHTQSGYEKKVKSNLEARIQSMNMEEKIFEVVIPMEDVVEFKGGRKQVVQRKVFPGYLLVRCDMDDSSWYVIRNTPGVTGFVGQGRFGQKPTPLSRREVDTFLSAKGDGVDTPRRSKPRLEYDVGEIVRVKEGPFADFTGSVAEINFDHLKLKVLVNIFGRETLVEMDFSQVAKI
jgi:transcriptional antiterminator NusG